MQKKFVLYDGRAKVINTDDAIAIDMADSEDEAIKIGKENWYGHNAIWCEYDLDGCILVNEKKRYDLPPCARNEVYALRTVRHVKAHPGCERDEIWERIDGEFISIGWSWEKFIHDMVKKRLRNCL